LQKMVFLNTSWMERYEGLQGTDSEIHGGGSYVDQYGYGHEIFNFKVINGKVYGYAQPKGYNNLLRLGGTPKDEYIQDVLAIFTARHKDGGTYIVGWYKNATFFKDYQISTLPERKFRNEIIGYYTMADASDATLLSIDERFSFPIIPRRVKGGMGQSNVWYADSPEMDEFKQEVLKHIEKYQSKKNRRIQSSFGRQADIEIKKRIEKIAISEVTREYTERGFCVTSVEAENIGWDLEATHNRTTLKIEVKGLAGSKVAVELTPNEFIKMTENKDNYRLCVVTECLDVPLVHVFSFSTEQNEWLSDDGYVLLIDQIISAHCYL